MASPWPEGFQRVPDADWTRDPIDELARAYDTVEQHGWYDNLNPTADAIVDLLEPGDLLLDYSGGTGILVDRLLERGLGDVGVLNLDSSPKFLRLCLEKFREEPRLALRRIPYLHDRSRLAYPHEVVDGQLRERGFQALASTNAIHLYYDLAETLESWRRLVNPEGRAFVQSGNVDREDRPADRRIIDQTVEAVDRAAREIVRSDDGFADHRDALEDEAFLAAHEDHRDAIFPPPRDASHYEDCFEQAGFRTVETRQRPITVQREEWAQFLKVYHQGVVGWVGGAEKVTGEPTPEPIVEDRHRLIDRGLERVLDGAESFQAEWTYWTLAPA